MVTTPEMQEEKGISGNVTIYASVRHHDNPGHGTRNARGDPLQVYINVYVCSQVFYWTGPCWIYIYIVFCVLLIVVFYNVPPLTGQVLGKVLLTSWEIS